MYPYNYGYNCGFLVCLYGEALLLNQGNLRLTNLNMAFERKRILWNVSKLAESDEVPYRPRAANIQAQNVAMSAILKLPEIVPDIQPADKRAIKVPPLPRSSPRLQTPNRNSLSGSDSDSAPISWSPMLHSRKSSSASSDDSDAIPVRRTTRLRKIISSSSSGTDSLAVLAQADIAGENQAEELGGVVNAIAPQQPITNPVFAVPKLPVRRSPRIQDRDKSKSASRSPSPRKQKLPPNALGNKIPISQRCYKVHTGWHCAAASAKHFPEYFSTGNLGDKKCKHCGALLFPHESSGICCKNGRVVLPPLSPHPDELKELMVGGTGQSKESKEFVKHMAKYNNLMQFASVSAGSRPSPEGGPMAVILNGEFHRRISSMRAGSQQIPGFSQLYILDPTEASEYRRKNPIFTGLKIKDDGSYVQSLGLNEKTLEKIETMIQRDHPAAKAFKQAREQLQILFDQQQSDEELRFFRLILLNQKSAPPDPNLQNHKLHPHQIVTPSTAEGWFSIHADPSGAPAPRGIWIENTEGNLHEVAPYNPWTDSLTYPLVHPLGDKCYHLEIPYAKLAHRRRKPKKDESEVDSDDDVDRDSDDTKSLASTDNDSLTDSADSESVASSDAGSSCSHRAIKSRKYISLRDYCKYRLAIREQDREYHPILSCGGGLGQRWVLDQAAKVDWQTASFLRRPDMDMRSSTADSLLQYWINKYNQQQRKQNPKAPLKKADDIGSVIRFTQKDVNSHPWWKAICEDCTAIFARLYDPKKARFFITFTNNREWPEFKAHLYNNGQTLIDRPDLWMRIYKDKQKKLFELLFKKNIFGHMEGWGLSLEFQGRGGPHNHIVTQTDLPAIPDVIKDYIWAHIPNEPDKDDDTDIAEMHRTIRKLITCQLHKCDESWCGKRKKNGRCEKHFPAPFSNTTILHPDRPAVYYRPSPKDGGATIVYNKRIYNNSHVVPYSPFLLCGFQCHHNVEFMYGGKANVKYVFKYAFKGKTYCFVEFTDGSATVINLDEPAQYARMHFRPATEAFAMLISDKFAELSHHVVRLYIHLPGQQKISFRAGQADQVAQQVQQGNLPDTALTDYWRQWRNDWQHKPEYKDMLFEQVPERFWWDDYGKIWKRYKKKPNKPSIGRILPVSPHHQQKFALYQLTRHFPGDPDYFLKELTNSSTFVEAATQLGLLEDDQIWHKTLEEASLCQMPDQMRWLFVSILVFGKPNNALELWEKFKDQMYNIKGITSAADKLARELRALSDIDWRLYNFGFTCTHFNLPEPPNPIAKNSDEAIKEFFYGDDDNQDSVPGQQQQQNPPTPLDADQQRAFDMALRALTSDPGDQQVPRLFNLKGGGGVGKSELLKRMIRTFRKPPNYFKVVVCASTGCAAILLPYGKTAHSTFRLGRDVSKEQLPNIPLESFFARRIREAQFFICDEITMLHNEVIETIDLICKQMAAPPFKQLRFGGKSVVFSGDIKQTLPVVQGEGMLAQVMACFYKSGMFEEFTTIELTINHRMGPGQQEYLKMCNTIGKGETGDHFWIPAEFIVRTEKELIESIFPDFKNLLGNRDELLKHLILAPHNDTCDAINEYFLDKVPGQIKEYLSYDKPLDERPVDKIDAIDSEVAALNRRTDSGMPPHRLRLKVGCVVVLLINKSDQEGLINGTRLIIDELGENKIIGTVINGARAGQQLQFFIERTRNTYEEKHPGGIKYERLQFPIKLAFAMTILKGQGQSIQHLGIDLEKDVFSHGQLYTAFSRATDGKNVRVYAPGREEDAKGSVNVANVVAPQLKHLF